MSTGEQTLSESATCILLKMTNWKCQSRPDKKMGDKPETWCVDAAMVSVGHEGSQSYNEKKLTFRRQRILKYSRLAEVLFLTS